MRWEGRIEDSEQIRRKLSHEMLTRRYQEKRRGGERLTERISKLREEEATGGDCEIEKFITTILVATICVVIEHVAVIAHPQSCCSPI